MGRLFALSTVALAVASCGSPTYTGGYVAPAYSPSYTRAAPPDAQQSSGIWYLRCRADQMTSEKTCSAETKIDYVGGGRANTVVGTMSYTAPENRISIVTAGYPLLVRARVDEHQPHTFRCVTGICLVNAQPLLNQMERGSRLLIDIQGRDAGYPEPQTFSLSGFSEMKQAAQQGAAAR